jgi:hypothetical protein
MWIKGRAATQCQLVNTFFVRKIAIISVFGPKAIAIDQLVLCTISLDACLFFLPMREVLFCNLRCARQTFLVSRKWCNVYLVLGHVFLTTKLVAPVWLCSVLQCSSELPCHHKENKNAVI